MKGEQQCKKKAYVGRLRYGWFEAIGGGDEGSLLVNPVLPTG